MVDVSPPKSVPCDVLVHQDDSRSTISKTENGDNTCDGGGMCSGGSDAADIRMRRALGADRSVTIVSDWAMGGDGP